MIVLKKATAILRALVEGLGIELHPKVAASGVGATTAAAILGGLAIAGVHIAATDQDILAVACTILAGYIHPAE